MNYIIIYFKTDGLAYSHINSDNSLMTFEKYNEADKECLKIEKEFLKDTTKGMPRIVSLGKVENPKDL